MRFRRVEITSAMRETARYMASRRNVNEGHFGGMVYDSGHRFENLASEDTHLIGALGEVVVARHFGVSPDLVFKERGGSEPWDLLIPDDGGGEGVRVEVKSGRLYEHTLAGEKMRPQHLYVDCRKFSSRADLFVRCAIDLRRDAAYIVGAAWMSEVRDGEVVVSKSGSCFRVREEDLWMPELV